MKRRDFLKALPIGAAAAAIPFSFGGLAGNAFAHSPMLSSLLGGADPTDRVLVLINLAGGNDGLNTVIPYADPAYTKARPGIGFNSAAEQASLAGTILSTSVSRPGLALNPAFGMVTGGNTSFMNMFKAGKVAVVQNVGYANPSLSHFRSTDIWNTASDSKVVIETGWVGRYLKDKYPSYPLGVQSGDDPIAIQIGAALNPVFQGPSVGMGLAVVDPSRYAAAKHYDDDPAPATNEGAELSYVRDILLQSDTYGDRFKTLFPTVPKPNVSYPTSTLAQQLQKVAWCISKGMKTKVYFCQIGGFDTHINQYSKTVAQPGQGQLHMQVADAIAAFQADLEFSGNADRVIGMTYSEFGRRVNENGNNGTDHGTASPQFLFGSQINGEVYGSNPNLTDLDSNADLKWEVDFRQLYSAVLGDWFGTSQTLRKSLLLDQTATGERFPGQLTVNGTSKTQSLIRTPATGAVGKSGSVVDNFMLKQNFPNPFVQATTISFALADTRQVSLEVFDMRGERMANLVNDRLGRGEHQFTFDGSKLPSGTYIYRLVAGEQSQTKQMTLVR